MKKLQLKVQIFLFSIMLACVLVSHYGLMEIVNVEFLFYFDGNYTDFKTWFPRFGPVLYVVQILLKIAAVVLAVYIPWRLKKYFEKHRMEISRRSSLSREILIFAVLLVLYLTAYFLFPVGQLFITRFFLFQILLQLLWFFLLYFKENVAYMKSYLFEPQLPYNIAILRIFFFAYLCIYYSSALNTYLPVVSLEHKVELPLIGWLVNIVPVNVSLYTFFVYAALFSAVMSIIGFKTRFFLIVHAICCFYVIATPSFFGKLWHNQIIIWVSWFFTFSRCYDVLSLDAMISKKELRKSADYTFPVRFVWIQFGIMYFWAGYYKLWDGGFDWALSRSMINQVQLEWLQHYDKMPIFRVDKLPWLLYIGGLLAIFFEMSYIILVFHKTWRWIAFTGGLLMHNFIGYFMYIAFPMLQILYIFFIDFNIFFRKKNLNIIEKNTAFSKVAFYTGVVIIGMNFLCGMFTINSYPFSSYPTYSSIIEDNVQILDFRCGKLGCPVHEIGKKNDFGWESYGWMEYSIIKDFNEGKNIQEEVENYWKIWVNHNPELEECDKIEVYITERPVSPEGKKNLKTIGYICTITPRK